MHRTLIGAAWDDPARCSTAVAAGAAMPRSRFRLRAASWNLEGFPEGPLRGASKDGTDIEWLACDLLWLDVDVVALQGLTLDRHGLVALDRLVTRLGAGSHTTWQWQVDGCVAGSRPQVAILWRTDRVQGSLVVSHPEIDLTAPTDAEHPDCPGRRGPALGVYVRSVSGPLGFHFVTFALAAGQELDALQARRAAWRQLGGVVKARARLRPDGDVLIAAAFNSVGGRGEERVEAQAEHDELKAVLAKAEPPLTLLAPTDACSEYSYNHARATDFMVMSGSSRAGRGVTPRAAGLCGALHCQEVDPEAYLALKQLSSHCPLVFDLNDLPEK